jgi:hypothetical protein
MTTARWKQAAERMVSLVWRYSGMCNQIITKDDIRRVDEQIAAAMGEAQKETPPGPRGCGEEQSPATSNDTPGAGGEKDQIVTERWECGVCGLPCRIEIVADDSAIPWRKGQSRFRDRECPCREPVFPNWTRCDDPPSDPLTAEERETVERWRRNSLVDCHKLLAIIDRIAGRTGNT